MYSVSGRRLYVVIYRIAVYIAVHQIQFQEIAIQMCFMLNAYDPITIINSI